MKPKKFIDTTSCPLSPSPVLTRPRITRASARSYCTPTAVLGAVKCVISEAAWFARDVKRNTHIWMCSGSSAPVFCRKHRGSAWVGSDIREESRGCRSFMHFDRENMRRVWSRSGVRHFPWNTWSSGMGKVLSVSGTFSSQKLERRSGTVWRLSSRDR